MTDDDTRESPANELDLSYLMTNPAWGRNIPTELREQLKKIIGSESGTDPETGQPVIYVEKKDLLSLLNMYSRDLRLGNLSTYNGEMEYCQYYLDLAGDCLRAGYPKAYLKCLSNVITILELSQSKGGFLRRQNNTIRQEKSIEEAPAKTGLWAGKNKQR